MIEIPNFTVEKELGRGGMATVYLAVQDMLSRHVALKVMLPDMARDESFRKIFLSEGKIIANLEHPNIVRIHEFGIIDDSILYMAMEYLSDDTLKERIAEGKISYESAVQIIEDTSAGLSYAHNKGYIHRDIKPGNILFRENDTAVITDFGIAKLQDTSGELTRLGYTMGTVQYMSPEQAVTTDLDHRSDIYSLGLVFYEMLTGQKAFKAGSTIQAIHQHTTVAPPALPLQYCFLQPIIDKVLAKEPDDRYQDINDFVDAVKNANEEDVTVVHQISQQFDDDSTQLLRTDRYQVNTQADIKIENKSKKGLFASFAAGLVLMGGLAFGITKYPEINFWLNKEDPADEKKELQTQKNLDDKKKQALDTQKQLEDKNAAKAIAEKEEQKRINDERENQRLQAKAEFEKFEAEKQEREKVIAEKIENAKQQAKEDKKHAESERQREIAEANLKKLKAEKIEKDKALHIASAKKQAEENRKNAEAQLKKIEADKKERERILAEQIANAKKHAEEVQKLKKEQQAKEELQKAELDAEKQAEKDRLSKIEIKRKEAERQKQLKAEQEEIIKNEKVKARKEKEKLDLALAKKKKIADEKLKKDRLKAEDKKREAEIIAQKKQKEVQLRKQRIAEQQRINKANKEQQEKLALAKRKAWNEKRRKELAIEKARQNQKDRTALAAKNKKAQLTKQRIAEQQRIKKSNQEEKTKIALVKRKALELRRNNQQPALLQWKNPTGKSNTEARKKNQQELLMLWANTTGKIRTEVRIDGNVERIFFIVTKNGKQVRKFGWSKFPIITLPIGKYVLTALGPDGQEIKKRIEVQQGKTSRYFFEF